MFRLYRKTICRRWHGNFKNFFKKKSPNVKPNGSVLFNSEKHDYSNGGYKKQHADKKDKQFWDDPHFNCFIRTSFQTASYLGTVAVCFNNNLKYINSVLEYERNQSPCIFANIVHASPKPFLKNKRPQRVLSLPKHHTENEKCHSSPLLLSPQSGNCETFRASDSILSETITYTSEKDKVLEDADVLCENIKILSEKHSIVTENSIGVKNIDKNDKKAFHFFQNAARHGSTAGFYNLGLCYQLGKGTRVNLNMAAYCYRRAAMKGHGLASFNLAVFFHKGIGGLPVDTKIAKELLAEAAEKNVPEAQLYFGILFLEEKKWTDAVRVFSKLVEKNIPAAQYYLGLCYEYGLGVQRNEKLAFELFKKSAEQGNKNASDKLENRKKGFNDNSRALLKTDGCKATENSSLHLSMSAPELGAIVEKPNQSLFKLPILAYLIVNNHNKLKENFYSNEKFVKEDSNKYFSFKSLSAVVMEVKSQL